jgi:hypothetical protein
MLNSEPKDLTDLAGAFLEPANSTHRQYEALRAFFVEGSPSAEVARSFGYKPGSFRVSSTDCNSSSDSPMTSPRMSVV